jgi:16S rRNA (adenine1518-N6/adenine1519-N6)-dimethyltransferase
LEIGGGTGVLTRALLRRAAHVTVVERDRELIPLLEETFAEEIAQGRLRVVEADGAQVSYEDLLGPEGPRVLAGNLPYQITGKLVERAIHAAAALERVVVMVQLEVAERLVAMPGTKEYGALSVFTQAAFDAKIIRRVPKGAFFPPPDITSAVVALAPCRPPRALETDTFRSVVKDAFGMRRKTLRNAWRALGEPGDVERWAQEAGVNLDARGETLGVSDFARMADAIRRPRPAL